LKCMQEFRNVRFDVFTAVTMKNSQKTTFFKVRNGYRILVGKIEWKKLIERFKFK
jgi:hypothetical protein